MNVCFLRSECHRLELPNVTLGVIIRDIEVVSFTNSSLFIRLRTSSSGPSFPRPLVGDNVYVTLHLRSSDSYGIQSEMNLETVTSGVRRTSSWKGSKF